MADVDITKRFVRVIEERADGLVSFEFSIGDPALFVELLLPATAFEDFCAMNDVVHLGPDRGDHDAWSWSLHDANDLGVDLRTAADDRP